LYAIVSYSSKVQRVPFYELAPPVSSEVMKVPLWSTRVGRLLDRGEDVEVNVKERIEFGGRRCGRLMRYLMICSNYSEEFALVRTGQRFLVGSGVGMVGAVQEVTKRARDTEIYYTTRGSANR
jgi:hypothetical protein